jgi:hypothetical protein
VGRIVVGVRVACPGSERDGSCLKGLSRHQPVSRRLVTRPAKPAYGAGSRVSSIKRFCSAGTSYLGHLCSTADRHKPIGTAQASTTKRSGYDVLRLAAANAYRENQGETPSPPRIFVPHEVRGGLVPPVTCSLARSLRSVS